MAYVVVGKEDLYSALPLLVLVRRLNADPMKHEDRDHFERIGGKLMVNISGPGDRPKFVWPPDVSAVY